jgi:hypothetical protein
MSILTTSWTLNAGTYSVQCTIRAIRSYLTTTNGIPGSSVADPDPYLYKFSDKLLQKFFLPKYALKSIFLNQKVKQRVILKYLWLLHTPKKLIQGHLLRPGSGPRSGSATLPGRERSAVILDTINYKLQKITDAWQPQRYSVILKTKNDNPYRHLATRCAVNDNYKWHTVSVPGHQRHSLIFDKCKWHTWPPGPGVTFHIWPLQMVYGVSTWLLGVLFQI